MSKFLTGKRLSETIEEIIWKAKNRLLIVSPYVKLDNHFKRLFDNHTNNPKLHILIVFGKNQEKVSRSMSKNDFDYFKKFMNVSVVYAENLHAKYYGNENQGIITSINLYDYSFINNIEFGVFFEQTILNNFKKTPDDDAWEECQKIAENSKAIFIKRPVFEKKKFLINIGENYVKSDVLYDVTEDFYNAFKTGKLPNKKISDFPSELELGSSSFEKPERIVEEKEEGYCIRTGKRIKFNPKQPLSKEAWIEWKRYENPNYPEKFCHKTGQPSKGKTSMNNPIL